MITLQQRLERQQRLLASLEDQFNSPYGAPAGTTRQIYYLNVGIEYLQDQINKEINK